MALSAAFARDGHSVSHCIKEGHVASNVDQALSLGVDARLVESEARLAVHGPAPRSVESQAQWDPWICALRLAQLLDREFYYATQPAVRKCLVFCRRGDATYKGSR